MMAGHEANGYRTSRREPDGLPVPEVIEETPGGERSFERFFKCDKIVESSAASIVLAANRCLRQITMTVTERIIAFAIKLRVLGIGKNNSMQTMRSIERHPHSKENAVVAPNLREKIIALVQTDTV